MSVQISKTARGKFVLSICALALGSLVLAPESQAQYPGHQQQQQTNTPPAAPGERAPKRRGEQMKLYQANEMKRPVELPNVPGFTGKQAFISGMEYPNNRNGTGYFMIMNTANPKDQVKDWWDNALRMHQWEVNSSGPGSLRADQPKYGSLSIEIQDVVQTGDKRSEGMRSSYSIFFSPPVRK